MAGSLGLQPLFTALRDSGLPVGVAEIARLQRVFALGAEPGGDRLKNVLRAVLVKSAEERATFERVYEAWISRADQDLDVLAAPRVLAKNRETLPVARRPRRFLWRALAPAVLVLASLALDRHFKVPPSPVIPPVPSKPAAASSSTTAATPVEIRTVAFTTWVPILSVAPGKPVWRGWVPLALGALALLTSGGLWLALRGRRWFPPPAPAPVKKGPPRVFLAPPQLAGPRLLTPREQEALVWGIGQFVAEETTRRLDLPATVRATARSGGIPKLRFHYARYPREVWLWVDEAADDPEIRRLADEVEAALLAYGLPVERALFRGIPDRLVNAAGQSFAPNEVDERREAALVAILTDGRLLARHATVDDLRVRLDALLRGLSHWPRLAFVDFSLGPGEIGGILDKHSLERIAPGELAAFLGGGEPAGRLSVPAVAGDAVWAAACALASASVDEARAFEVRRRLGLAVSPWALKTLRMEAPGPPGRLQWRPSDRARLVNWLREAEEQPAGGVAAGSLLGRALAFWEETYDRELNGLDSGEGEVWWQGTPAHQHLTMERALLGLWRNAPDAVRELYRLYGGALRDPVARHLGSFAPVDWGGPEHVHMPWSWPDRSATERAMLQEMGLGGGMPLATLQRPGRLWVGLSVCLGLAAGALGTAALSGMRLPAEPPLVVHGPGKPPDAQVLVQKTSAQEWVVSVVTNSEKAVTKAAAGAQVFVRWQEQRRLCRNGEMIEENGMVFVHICPGTFTMGSNTSNPRAYPNEIPVHEVTLSEYWIGKFEVTNAQYGNRDQQDLPVTDVTWFDASNFCARHGWSLPTEAQWENAARAGKQTAWFFGDDEKALGDYAWFKGNSTELHAVGTRNPNPWGLYDMYGNAWEWVSDHYQRYQAGAQTNPTGPSTGDNRAMRGGAFYDPPKFLRSAFRNGDVPTHPGAGIGFRCARDPRRQP